MKLIILTFAILVSVVGSVVAQQQTFTVGERVEYKDKSYPTEVWKEGTVVRVDPQYHQVIVRWDPRDDYPSYTRNGVSTYEQAYSMDNVRTIKPKTEQPAANDGAGANNAANRGPETKPAMETPRTANAGGLMSKQEIFDYMKTHGYANGQPKHDLQVCRDLIEMMKKRGVKEALDAGKDYDGIQLINANGCAGAQDTDVTEASYKNLGVPPTINWLAGTWTLTVFGDTVYSAPGDGYIYEQGPKTGTQGSLTISTNGTYIWNDGKGQVLKGAWRNATAEEMNVQGGTGIVLLHAAQGRDWIVFKFQSRVPNKSERINVEDLEFRGSSRWMGWRR